MTEQPVLQSGRPALFSRRHFAVGAALAATSAVAFARQPEVAKPVLNKKRFEGWIPDSFGPWSTVAASGVVLPPPDALSDRLYDNLVTRVYKNGDNFVMFLIAYNNMQDGVLQVHRPEVCYPVGGFVLSRTEELRVTTLGREIPFNAFTARGPDRIEHVLYFTRLGGAYPRSWSEQRIAVIQENLAGRIPDGILFRASVLGNDRGLSMELLKAFFKDFARAAPSRLQNLLFV